MISTDCTWLLVLLILCNFQLSKSIMLNVIFPFIWHFIIFCFWRMYDLFVFLPPRNTGVLESQPDHFEICGNPIITIETKCKQWLSHIAYQMKSSMKLQCAIFIDTTSLSNLLVYNFVMHRVLLQIRILHHWNFLLPRLSINLKLAFHR